MVYIMVYIYGNLPLNYFFLYFFSTREVFYMVITQSTELFHIYGIL